MNDHPQYSYYDPSYTPRRAPKRIGTGGVIAIILVSCFALLLLAGAIVGGFMLFDADSPYSIYRRLDPSMQNDTSAPEEVDPGESSSSRPHFDNGTEYDTTPQTPMPSTEAESALPGSDELHIDVSHAADSMDGITVGDGSRKLTNAQIYTKCAPSTVFIYMEGDGFAGCGTGIVMTSDGYILTNHHVIANASAVKVTFADGSEYPAVVVGSDEPTDLAVLRIDCTGLPHAVFGNSDKVVVGDDVNVIGNPLGTEASLAFTMTRGIISTINRNITVNGYTMTMLQTDAAVNPGNSGGPLFNMAGEVIGVISAKMMTNYSNDNVEGIGFAIPINYALEIARDLAAHGRVTGRAYIGITIQTQYAVQNNQYVYQVVVMSVEPDSPAARAGFQVGDVIRSFAGADVEQNSDLLAERDRHKPGETVDVVVVRGEERITLSLTLEEAQ